MREFTIAAPCSLCSGTREIVYFRQAGTGYETMHTFPCTKCTDAEAQHGLELTPRQLLVARAVLGCALGAVLYLIARAIV